MNKIDVFVYLPLYYNDGAKVEDEMFTQTFEELAERFGGGTIFEDIKGIWYSGGKKYEDEIKIVEITVPDAPEVKEWFNVYARDTLKHRFKQEKIWLKFRKSEVD